MESSTEAIPLQSNAHQHDLSAESVISTDVEKRTQLRAVSAWKPGIVKRFPLFGLLPLLLSIACTCIASAIVVLSNETPVDGWWSGVRQPGVLLAYTSTISNALLGIAFSEATVIFFWTRAVTGHLSVGNLHYNWLGSTGIVGAVKAVCRKRAIRISFVSIFVTATTLLRGPLIQRASYVRNVDIVVSGQVELPVLQDVEGYGGISSGSNQLLRYSPEFSTVIADFLAKTPIKFSGTQCKDCTLQVKAFGFSVFNCSTSYEKSYNLSAPTSSPTTGPATKGPPLFSSNITLSNFTHVETAITITIERKGSGGCTVDMIHHECNLIPALVSYALDLNGDVASLKYANWKDDSVLELRNMSIPPPRQTQETPTTILPLQRFGSKLWDSYSPSYSAGQQPLGDPGLTWSGTTTKDEILPNIFCADPGYGDPCKEYYNDPMDYLINSYRELAFRLSVLAAIKNGTYQAVPYTSHLVQAQYTARNPALTLAVIVSLLGPLATLILFWNWWKLGRSFSMSPLELANAILPYESLNTSGTDEGQISGIFADCSSNVAADKLASHVSRKAAWSDGGSGEPMLQYGVLESTGRLAFGFAKSGLVREPKKGELL